MLGWAMLKNATKVAHCPMERFFVLGVLECAISYDSMFGAATLSCKICDEEAVQKTAYGLFQHATTRECPSHSKSSMSMTASNYHAAADREATDAFGLD